MARSLRTELAIALPNGTEVLASVAWPMKHRAPLQVGYHGASDLDAMDISDPWEVETVKIRERGTWKAASAEVAAAAECYLRDHPERLVEAFDDERDSAEIRVRTAEWRANGRLGTELGEYVRTRGLDAAEE